MWIVIVVIVIGLILTGIFVRDDFHPPTAAMLGVLFTALAAFLVGIAVDVYYARQSFVAATACEVKRMAPRRQMFTSNVVCVPGYIATRNDTTTVNLSTKP